MKLSKRWAAAALLAAFAFSSAAFAADATYAIKLHRAFKVGDQYDTHLTIDRTTVSTITPPQGGPQTNTDSVKGDLTGRVEVKNVDKTGEAVGVVLTVKKLVDGAGKDLVEAGKEIEITRGEKDVTLTMVGGGTVSDDARKLLEEMFPKHRADQPTDDEIFGSKTPRKVGESWPIDADVAAKDLSDTGVAISGKDLKGTVTLKAVEGSGAAQGLRVEGQFGAKGIKPASPDPGVTVDSCDIDAELSGLFPVDVALQPAESNLTMSAEIHMSATGAPVKIEMKMQGTQKETITQVKK